MESLQTHAPVSAETLAQSFEEADVHVVDLSGYREEDWITFGLFWTMCALVFLQFFTRYVMNDSYAWTEELATYCLMAIVFIGSSMCIRQNRHIQVDFLYRYLPAGFARVLATVVDIVRIGFLGYVSILVFQYIRMVGNEPMTTIDWPKSIVYWLALAGFILMTFRAAIVARDNWRQGYSILERPEVYDGTGA